jgi:hypothetical protein
MYASKYSLEEISNVTDLSIEYLATLFNGKK